MCQYWSVGLLACGCHVVCLMNCIGKCHFDKAIYDLVHHTNLVNMLSAL